jgi:hypothetical protein
VLAVAAEVEEAVQAEAVAAVVAVQAEAVAVADKSDILLKQKSVRGV